MLNLSVEVEDVEHDRFDNPRGLRMSRGHPAARIVPVIEHFGCSRGHPAARIVPEVIFFLRLPLRGYRRVVGDTYSGVILAGGKIVNSGNFRISTSYPRPKLPLCRYRRPLGDTPSGVILRKRKLPARCVPPDALATIRSFRGPFMTSAYFG